MSEERPDPSDFQQEMEAEAYMMWCQDNGLDWYRAATAVAYQEWYDESRE